ncbi:unnamed protein product [Gongylonema pulchrum]|uniref:DUF4347 domain-containing protein n=1 Tax=Gongylonema pulchrum TaxID=637853 RepID=A0A183D4Y6_9BILA|nr:unnamed protein product [Gongylonema pulchrum]
MYLSPVVVLLLLVDYVVADPKCDPSAYKLSMIAVHDGNDDAFERLRHSAERYSIDFTVVDLAAENVARNLENTEIQSTRFRQLLTEIDALKARSTHVLLVDGLVFLNFLCKLFKNF